MSRRHTETAADETTGDSSAAIPVVRAPLSRAEAVRRIGNTLKALASDDDRSRVLDILQLTHGA
jgi:hypothetical protein